MRDGNDKKSKDVNDTRRRPRGVLDVIKAAYYMPIPNFIRTPDYIKQVGAIGLLLVLLLLEAYDNGVKQNKCEDGWLALPDGDLAEWQGLRTTSAIRRARKKVLMAHPPLIEEVREGNSGQPTEYLDQLDAEISRNRIGSLFARLFVSTFVNKSFRS